MVQNLFRNIENTVELRKEILQSSKEVIETLKSYQKILNINEQKNELINMLKLELKEIKIFFDKTKELFPTNVLKEYDEGKAKKKTSKKTSSKDSKREETKIHKMVVRTSELEQLESKLTQIENKLKTLS